MLIPILLAVAVLAVVFVVVVARRPDTFRVTRATTIAAAPAAVFAHVNDLRKWQQFSPWAKMDPAAKIEFSGPPTGVDSAFTWAGNKQIGEGRMTLTESVPAELIGFRLDFAKPFKATNTAEFTFKNDGGRTVVSWSMSGANTFLFKAVGLFIDCEKMVGAQFEQGLANLKTIVEAEVKK